MTYSYGIINGKIEMCAPDVASIFEVLAPDTSERQWLENDCSISLHNITSALDPDEIGRLELEDDHLALILKTPQSYNSEDNLIFRVTSMGVFVYKDRLVILSAHPESCTEELQKNTRIYDLPDVLLKLIAATISHFLGHLKVINMISESLEEKVNSSMANEHLLSMFKIEKSLVYYLNGINCNNVVMEKLRMNARKISFKSTHSEYLDDIIIDNSQCNKQAEIYSNILTGLMDARGSIVNNNLNLLIKRLTILSVVFMPLNVLTGIGGMSEFSAMTLGIPTWFSYSLFFVGLIITGIITYNIIKYFTGEKTVQPKQRKRLTSKKTGIN